MRVIVQDVEVCFAACWFCLLVGVVFIVWRVMQGTLASPKTKSKLERDQSEVCLLHFVRFRSVVSLPLAGVVAE